MELVEEYLERHPSADWDEAYEATADAANERYRDKFADMVDAAKQRAKDERPMAAPVNDTCDKCGKNAEELHWFAAAFRKNEIRLQAGRTLETCAARAPGSLTGKRLADQMLA